MLRKAQWEAAQKYHLWIPFLHNDYIKNVEEEITMDAFKYIHCTKLSRYNNLNQLIN